MNSRPALLVGALTPALALTLALPSSAATTGSPARQPRAAATATDDPGQALRRIRADADGPVRAQRDADGLVDHLASTTGDAVLPAPAGADTTREVADAQLDRYGEAFGIDGDSSEGIVRRTLPSATGGSVVRVDQVVDGVPVFGGQVVMSLDQDNGLVSVDADTTTETSVARAGITQQQAGRAARAVVAKVHRVDPGALRVSLVGRRLYDPVVVHVSDPRGARPVWQFAVADGREIRETVLIGAVRGEVALRFNEIDHLSRVVCDNDSDASTDEDEGVPSCDNPVRSEGDAATGIQDVDEAYDNLGVVAEEYDELNGTDLTALIGATPQGGTKSLMATVRWCFAEPVPDPRPGVPDNCPYANAFWDGTQMVFGQGYAGADDVVGHELTHGYVERTSNLFALHQSGAINESVADTIGEIIDHRNTAAPNDFDANWLIGEDLPGEGALRSLKDPTLYGQPDRMQSPSYQAADFYVDNGEVHENDGVGNKTAYLISQGGTFNGQTISGIDAGDATLTQTGLLYLETIKRLTSGAQYADLGTVLGSTCDELVAANHRGSFVASDCANVRKAALATELAKPPADPSAPASVTASCPTGYVRQVLLEDNDLRQTFGWSTDPLWQRTPANGSPANAAEGSTSLFAWDPDPELGDSDTSEIVSISNTVGTGLPTYLYFKHAYLFDYVPAFGGSPATFYDGGQVEISSVVDGGWEPVTGLPWINGPGRHVVGNTAQGFTGFAGDSRGYLASRVDLTSLTGSQVMVKLRVAADNDTAFLGWWVDDVMLYSCYPRDPSAVRNLRASSTPTTSTIAWDPPADVGPGIGTYAIDGPDTSALLPATRRSYVVPLRSCLLTCTVSVEPESVARYTHGPRSSITLRRTTGRLLGPVKVRKKKAFTMTGTVMSTDGNRGVGAMPVRLLRRPAGGGAWVTAASGRTDGQGVVRWRLKQKKAGVYQLVALGSGVWIGGSSNQRPVKVKR